MRLKNWVSMSFFSTPRMYSRLRVDTSLNEQQQSLMRAGEEHMHVLSPAPAIAKQVGVVYITIITRSPTAASWEENIIIVESIASAITLYHGGHHQRVCTATTTKTFRLQRSRC